VFRCSLRISLNACCPGRALRFARASPPAARGRRTTTGRLPLILSTEFKETKSNWACSPGGRQHYELDLEPCRLQRLHPPAPSRESSQGSLARP
jgi:hypothetical protein